MKHLGSVDIVSGFTPCRAGDDMRMSHRNRVRQNLPLMKVVVGSPVIVSTYQLRSCSSILTFIFSLLFILSDILVLSLLIFSTSYSFRYPRIVKNRASFPPLHFIHIPLLYISDMSSYSDYATDLKLTELRNFCFIYHHKIFLKKDITFKNPLTETLFFPIYTWPLDIQLLFTNTPINDTS